MTKSAQEQFAKKLSTSDRLYAFCRSLAAGRVLAKIGFETLTEIPHNLPSRLQTEFKNVARQHLDEVKAKGLDWQPVAEGQWRAQIRIPAAHDDDGCNTDILNLLMSADDESHPQLNIRLIALEQCVVSIFAQLDALLIDVLEEICRKDKRVLASNRQVKWQTIIEAATYEQLLSNLIQAFTLEFGYANLSERLELLRTKLGLEFEVPQEVLSQVLFAEQVRHLFTHTGGFVSKEFLERTKSSDYTAGDRIVINLDYCLRLSRAIELLGSHIVSAAERKFLR